MNLTEAKEIAGSLGFGTKMPGTSYGLPARECLAGKELAKLPGTICAACYALQNCYTWPNPLKAQYRRLEAINDPRWVDAMVTILTHVHGRQRIRIDLGITGVRLAKKGGSRFRYNAAGYHRWHESGDLQSLEHFEKIIEVCRRTPQIKHWLPTRELAIVRSYLGAYPANLVIRVSATHIDGIPPAGWPNTSTVHTRAAPKDAYECPAPRQGGTCSECRACWSKSVAMVSYHLH
jgi:hypothetical protein